MDNQALEWTAQPFLPRIRPDLIFGPAELSGGKTTYYVKDTLTNWFYRIGSKEYFLMSLMDGQHLLNEIGQEYTRTFGKRLDERAWAQFFTLLDKRQILANSIDAERLDQLKAAHVQGKKEQNRSLFMRRFPLIHPDRLLAHLLPFFQFAFHPLFVFPCLIATLCLEVFIFTHIGVILNQTLHIWNQGNTAWEVTAAFFFLFWLSAVIHEFSHALACKKYGGSVPEIGLLWRYLSFFPYCKMDDVILFHNRRHRIYAIFAGPFSNLIILLLAAMIWWLSPNNSFGQDLSALFLLGFNISTLCNFLPFLGFDGYLILNYALGLLDLRGDSHLYWKELLQRIFSKNKPPVRQRTRREKWIYAIYGIFSLYITACFILSMGIGWFMRLRMWWGNLPALGLIGLFVGLAVWQWLAQQHRQKSKQAAMLEKPLAT